MKKLGRVLLITLLAPIMMASPAHAASQSDANPDGGGKVCISWKLIPGGKICVSWETHK